MSQTLQILNRLIEEIDLAVIKAKAQLEYSADWVELSLDEQAILKLGKEENE